MLAQPKRGNTKLYVAGVFAILAIIFLLLSWNASKAPSVEARPLPVPKSIDLPSGGDWTSAPPPGAKARIKLRGDNGEEFEFDPTDLAGLDKALENFPPDKRDQIRDMLKNVNVREDIGPNGERRRMVFTRDPNGAEPKGMPAIDHDVVSRDAKSSADALRQLIDQGVPEEEARRIVSEALTDSISKQINDPNAKVKAEIISAGDGKQGVMLMVGVEEDGTDHPPAKPEPKK
jgi:hypothetical protein